MEGLFRCLQLKVRIFLLSLFVWIVGSSETFIKFGFFFLVFVFLGGCGRDDLYEELWKACAGPLGDVPVAGERVFYFPQGHMEQVKFIALMVSSISDHPFYLEGKK